MLIFSSKLNLAPHITFQILSNYRHSNPEAYARISAQLVEWNFGEWGYLLLRRERSVTFVEDNASTYRLVFFKNILIGALVARECSKVE